MKIQPNKSEKLKKKKKNNGGARNVNGKRLGDNLNLIAQIPQVNKGLFINLLF